MSFKDMDTSHTDDKLTVEEFTAARVKNVPEDRKEKAKEYVARACE
jgi:hypothetical protein